MFFIILQVFLNNESLLNNFSDSYSESSDLS